MGKGGQRRPEPARGGLRPSRAGRGERVPRGTAQLAKSDTLLLAAWTASPAQLPAPQLRRGWEIFENAGNRGPNCQGPVVVGRCWRHSRYRDFLESVDPTRLLCPPSRPRTLGPSSQPWGSPRQTGTLYGAPAPVWGGRYWMEAASQRPQGGRAPAGPGTCQPGACTYPGPVPRRISVSEAFAPACPIAVPGGGPAPLPQANGKWVREPRGREGGARWLAGPGGLWQSAFPRRRGFCERVFTTDLSSPNPFSPRPQPAAPHSPDRPLYLEPVCLPFAPPGP